MENVTEVRTFNIKLICDICGREMEMGKTMYMSYPPMYIYNCICGHHEMSSKTYPRIEYKPKGK